MRARYYKISPEWAGRLKLTEIAIRHPDGWYMVLAPRLADLPSLLPDSPDGGRYTIDGAVEAIGGCIYNEEEALASQRGEPQYMMNRDPEDGSPIRVPAYNLDGTPYTAPTEDASQERGPEDAAQEGGES